MAHRYQADHVEGKTISHGLSAPLAATARATRVAVVDAHVHFYADFDLTEFFDRATQHIRQVADELTPYAVPAGFLLLTETYDNHYFRIMRDEREFSSRGPWSLIATREPHSLIAEHEDGSRLFVVAGRQIATAEGLEVLALGVDAEFCDGRQLQEALSAATEAGAVPVIPYGFGKWWFRRGRLLAKLIDCARPGQFFLGDNAGRLRHGKSPAMFRRAAARHILTLPGSDPLPFPRQVSRVARYGFTIEIELDEEHPSESVMSQIRNLTAQPTFYGRRESLSAFCRNQAAMQLRRFRRSSDS